MKALKISAIVLGIIVIGIAIAGLYISKALPNTGPAEKLIVEITPARVERGKYLANHVTVCMDCHSKRDWTKYSGPINGNFGGGGELFSKDFGFPGNIYAPNISPYNLGSWTDGEILRAITTGVRNDGSALFPIMGYHRFGKMDREDVLSIIAYIRTIPSVENKVPATSLDFPVNLIVNTMPEKAEFSKIPESNNSVAYGAYLVNAAGCAECHSQAEKGQVIKGTELGGGMKFIQPSGVVVSPNISFGEGSAIAAWDKEMFIQFFRSFADSVPALGNKTNTPMPWTMYGGMTREDLAAIYDYLKTQKVKSPGL